MKSSSRKPVKPRGTARVVLVIELYGYTTLRSATTYDYINNVCAGMYPALGLQRYEYRIRNRYYTSA